MKRTLKVAGAFLLGVMLTTTSLSAMGIVNWKGSPTVEHTLTNLDDLEKSINNLKNDKSTDAMEYEKYAEQLLAAIKESDRLIAGRDESIKELQKSVLERDAQVEKLTNIIYKLEEENEQALKDVQRIDERVSTILENNR